MEALCFLANGRVHTFPSYLRKNMMARLNLILMWLKKPKVLSRLICVPLSVVGLVCFALSSSSNHLLGKWSWWKMLLYTVISFIVCLAVLFTPARSGSTSPRMEVNLAFLVLIITSVYSFWYDNLVKGKPDAYSLISCAAFATMSLGLSKLTQFGYQIDLLYFFCATLVVQLMKINLWLAIVGGGFSYSLISLISPRGDDPQGENLRLRVQNHVTIQVDPDSASSSSVDVITPQQANAEVDSTLGSSTENGHLTFQDHQVTQSNSHAQDGNVDDGHIIRLQLMDCIKELEKENQVVVPMVSSHVDRYLKTMFNSKDKDKNRIPTKQVPDVDVNLVMDALPSGIMKRLQETVKLMMEAGFEEECSDVYSKWRREFVEQCHWALGLQFQEPNMEDVEKWIKMCEVAGKILFPIERRLCDYLFSGFPLAADAYLPKVCKQLTIGLLSFVDTAITARSYLPNFLFNIVPKMYESLTAMSKECISLNLFELSILDYFRDVLERLDILNNFANLFHRNNARAHVADGGLHLITKQVMNYILMIWEDKIWRAPQSYRIVSGREKSSLWMLTARTIGFLESELEAKSRDYYADPALGYLFMIKNLSYIGEKAKYLKLNVDRIILDDDWFQQNTAKVEEYFSLYLESSWNKMLDFLKLETNESVAPGVVEKLMKDRLHFFNLHFDETCNVQSTWIVSDKTLRERMIKSIHTILLPEYGRFYDRFLHVFGDRACNYVLFRADEIENRVSNLFLLHE